MKYQVIVVGGGHAGVEAAMAAAHMGEETLLITLNIKMMANMPCNPSIGGSAKGIVVREIDALGGMMGMAADHEYLQIKMLNTSKGPGVQCLRAQADKKRYPAYMQHLVLHTPHLTVKEGMVVALLHDDKHVFGVRLEDGEEIHSQAVILTTGTYLESEVLVGHTAQSAGPDGERPSRGLSPYLASMGIALFRLKTGTPPRIKADTIDYAKAIPQYGMEGHLAFSYTTKTTKPLAEQITCYLIYTTNETHQIIRDNLDRSAMYGGLVTGVGPRYCPSIEDKIVRFHDKPRHQLFLEPESLDMNSIYLQGFSTSMPTDVQEKMVHSLPGLEHCEILKYAYAIEYDAIVPTQFDATLMVKKWPGLYGAGQIVGTSGYEEAAGLGLLAGINAVLRLRHQDPFILRRDEAYIGVMIDDLVTKGTNEPYRLLSSRAEYRLLLRHDNADLRLSEYGYQLGLISPSRYHELTAKKQAMERMMKWLSEYTIPLSPPLQTMIQDKGYAPLEGGIKAIDLLRRPPIWYEDIAPFLEGHDDILLDDNGIHSLEVALKYEGYIAKQKREAEGLQALEKVIIPEGIDYHHVDGLALEARQKLADVAPRTIGQASRISGVNPSDIAVLLLEIKRRQKR